MDFRLAKSTKETHHLRQYKTLKQTQFTTLTSVLLADIVGLIWRCGGGGGGGRSTGRAGGALIGARIDLGPKQKLP